MKSATAPSRSRSTTLPTAPPITSPSQSAADIRGSRQIQATSSPITASATAIKRYGTAPPENRPKLMPWFQAITRLSQPVSSITWGGCISWVTTYHLTA